jgi:GH25 family lysozyme M1 (1,4-beta-N-acetylmuramidase)
MPLPLILPLGAAAYALIRSLRGSGNGNASDSVPSGSIDRLCIDTYPGDVATPRNWLALVNDGRIDAAVLKASEGTYYRPGWFVSEWKRARSAGIRFVGAYHFLTWTGDDARVQADLHCDQLALVGFGGGTDINSWLDMEDSSHSPNTASRDTIIHAVNTFVERYRERTGRTPILYGNRTLHECGPKRQDKIFKSDLHTKYLWIARYTDTLPPSVYQEVGYTLDDIAAWQYAGDDGVTSGMRARGYIGWKDLPSFGKCDYSAIFKSFSDLCQ